MRLSRFLLSAIAASLATMASAMSPSDLKPTLSADESARYESLKSDSAKAQSFLITRDYVRKCKAVVDGAADPNSLPDQPDEFDDHYTSSDERKMMSKAIQLAISAFIEEKTKK
jgi:hypothetical protein